jgi:hypothetical protein
LRAALANARPDESQLLALLLPIERDDAAAV